MDLAYDLVEKGCYKKGSFQLKSGEISDSYLDLRELINHPVTLCDIADDLSELISKHYDAEQLQNTVICGLAYGAIPLATLVCERLKCGMIIIRKEKKNHGTGKHIEGFTGKKQCILIDDIISYGTSIRETLSVIKAESQLNVVAAYVVADRQFDRKELEIPVYSLVGMDKIVMAVNGKNLLTRSNSMYNRCSKRLLEIVHAKRSNLIVSIDCSDPTVILCLSRYVSDYVCAIKYHSDVWLYNVNVNLYAELQKLSKEKNFLLFEDRKFADIGSIVKKQYTSISRNYGYQSLNLVTVLPVAGAGTIDCIDECDNKSEDFGQLLVCQLSTSNNLIDNNFTENCKRIAFDKKESIAGFICQKRVCDDDRFLYVTPGVHISSTEDDKNQRYRTPEEAILTDGCDIIIVGRGITEHLDPELEAKKYRDISYENLLKKINVY